MVSDLWKYQILDLWEWNFKISTAVKGCTWLSKGWKRFCILSSPSFISMMITITIFFILKIITILVIIIITMIMIWWQSLPSRMRLVRRGSLWRRRDHCKFRFELMCSFKNTIKSVWQMFLFFIKWVRWITSRIFCFPGSPSLVVWVALL